MGKKISLTCDQVGKLEFLLTLANVVCECFFIYFIITMGLPANLNNASITLFLLAPFVTTLLFYIVQLTSIAIVGSYVTKFFSFPLTFSGALVSVFVTILAAYIGIFIEAPIASPLTYWLIAVNFVFDAFTVFTTLLVIMFINEDKTFFKAVIAICLDLVLAAIFACLSLYLSLFFTPYKITLLESFHVLIGKNFSGTEYAFGPYFWIMHTTFIPTFIYLMAIILCFLLKALYKPSEFCLRTLKINNNPISLLSAFIFLVNLLRKGLCFLLKC